MKEDWDLLLGFLPPGWEALAAESGALKGLRKDKSPENLLRVLLLHLGCGHSLRETAVRARRAGLADLSSVALMKRLAKAGPWLHSLCRALFEERGGALSGSPDGGFEVRLVDATTVKEPGKTGSLWRLHYSVRLPSLVCDHFRLTETEGPDGGSFDLLGAVAGLDRPGHASSWPAAAGGGSVPLAPGRVCAVRKSDAAIDLAHRKLLRKASRKGTVPKPQSLEFAKYVIVFTTLPEAGFTPEEVLDWYRLRWQVELVFKRFKSAAQLGHLPKRDGESSRAWLYGKLFTALLAEKLIAHASAVSPWGYDLPARPRRQQVA